MPGRPNRLLATNPAHKKGRLSKKPAHELRREVKSNLSQPKESVSGGNRFGMRVLRIRISDAPATGHFRPGTAYVRSGFQDPDSILRGPGNGHIPGSL